MENKGWIKLHRKLLDKGYYQNSQYVHLWVHLLLLANHKEHEFMWNGNMVMVKEGQIYTGRKELSKATGIPETTIERILKMLENEHQIGQQKTNKYRVITILNWKEHQDRTPERTTNGQQTDTYKNDKNVKNDIGASEDGQRMEYDFVSEEENPRTKSKPKYPHAKTVFAWFHNPQKSWALNTTELKHAELLFERGEAEVKKRLRYVREHEGEDFLPSITKPSDLERKWIDLSTYAKRNS